MAEADIELFKSNFYRLEGLEANTCWPKRKMLEGSSLKRVADMLATRQRLGSDSSI